MDGLIVPPGQGRKLISKVHELTFKVTGAHGSFASCFESAVPPGFDVGAHTHDRVKEFFYILEGELDLFAFEPTERTEDRWQDWESSDGNRVVRAGAGSCMFVPARCPHAFANPTDKPTRMLFQCAPPPDHERYVEEMHDILSAGRTVDSHAVRRVRERYGINQITPPRHGPGR